MKNRFNNILFLGLAGSLLVVGPTRIVSAAQSADKPAAARVSDDALEEQIEKALENNSVLAPRDLDVEAKQGVVTLTGKVRDAGEKSRAGELAKVTGVVRVDNNIEIDPKIDNSKIDAAADKTKSGLNKAVDATAKSTEKSKEAVQKGVGKTEQGVGKAAEKTAEAVGKAGEKTTDASITTRVKASFTGEKQLQNTAIDVDTSNQVVTLKGTVNSEAERARAEALASGTPGVARVVNQLVVR